jgi:hypothetical protein
MSLEGNQQRRGVGTLAFDSAGCAAAVVVVVDEEEEMEEETASAAIDDEKGKKTVLVSLNDKIRDKFIINQSL